MEAAGKKRQDDSRASAPSTTSCAAISCVRSTMSASRQMPRMTPLTMPTNGSRKPKSVVSVMIGGAMFSALLGDSRDAVRSAVAVHDEVRDQGQRLLVLGVLERAQRALRGLGVGMRSLERVVDALVLHHQAPDLFDLIGTKRMALEQHLDPLPLV